MAVANNSERRSPSRWELNLAQYGFFNTFLYNATLARPILRVGRGGDYLEIKSESVFEMKCRPGNRNQNSTAPDERNDR